jgi:allophanate hydrolase
MAHYNDRAANQDTLDIAGIPTTAACPDYAYTPSETAPAIAKLLEAGAILIGKTNLDQFASGLVGTRSPYGAPSSVFHPDYVSGGSSSGSAVAVRANLVSFSVATDTAGSGRVPAAFNGIFGLKPTKGVVSARGLVPACRTLDNVTFMGSTVDDVRLPWLVAKGYDPQYPFSRAARAQDAYGCRSLLHKGTGPSYILYALPTDDVLTCMSEPYLRTFDKVREKLRHLGEEVDRDSFDYTAYDEAGYLVYSRTFVAERLAALKPWWTTKSEMSVLPVISKILGQGESHTAQDAWSDIYTVAALTQRIRRSFDTCDVLIVPTAPFHPTKAEVEADPIGLNSKLGRFTCGVNVLDLCALAVPAGTIKDSSGVVLPFGITLVAPAFKEGYLIEVARRWEALE